MDNNVKKFFPLKDRAINILRRGLIKFKDKIKLHPWARSVVLSVLSPFPRLKERIKQIGQTMQNSDCSQERLFNRVDKQITLNSLSSDAKIIYEKLKTAFERQNKK